MFKNYLNITIRNLYREKLYALINIFGLSLGVGCCLILSFYVVNELSYDRHHERHENIYRVVNEYTFSGKTDRFALTSPALGPLLIRDFPESVKSFTRFQRPIAQGQSGAFRNGTDVYMWDDIFLADVNVFDVFTHDILFGNPEGALDDPYSMAVSESFAKTYFGEGNPVGKTLSSDEGQYRINLVFADLPENSHLKYDVLISYNRLGTFLSSEAVLQQMLGAVQTYTYLQMFDDFDEESFVSLFDDFETERFGALARLIGQADTFSVALWAQNLTDIHLNSDVSNDEPTGNKLSLYGIASVAGFILIIAVINYVNLSTARSVQRAREVGMRKVLGANRNQLILQFLGESFCLVLIAVVIAIVCVQVLLKGGYVDNLLGVQLSIDTVIEPGLLLLLLVAGLLVSFISGIYPAFYLSSMTPLIALAGGKESKRGGGRLRQFLVFVQFSISISIISSTLLMFNQMSYVSALPLGFDKANKLILTLRGANLIAQASTLQNELLTNPNILSASVSVSIPSKNIGLLAVTIENDMGVMEAHSVSTMEVGEDFLQTMNISLSQGRDFTEKFLTDVGNSILVNETLVKWMGWSQPIGKRMAEGLDGKVIGVVSDFHFDNLYHEIAPLAMVTPKSDFTNAPADTRALASQILILGIADSEVSETIRFVRDTMIAFDPDHPFEYAFLDELLAQDYQDNQTVMRLTGLFASICIFISCLGLFGLSSFTTEQRRKEIAIRKVLGSSALQIVSLVSENLLKLVLIGAVVASIITYYAINQWLNNFAYRIEINFVVFFIAAVISLSVAFLTTGLQSLKTVRANPVVSLRYE